MALSNKVCHGIILAALCVAAPTYAQQQSKALTNADIEQMMKAGLDEAIVVKAIESSPCAFDTTPSELIRLKSAGVPGKVISAMLTPGKPHAAAVTGPPAAAGVVLPDGLVLPEEAGAYALQNGRVIEIQSEVVNFRTGGLLKSMATMGMTGGHVNGTARGPHSPTKLTSAAVLYLRCPEGVTPGEYQLLDLWEKEGRREFRALTGGIAHASSGADKNLVEFSYDKVAPRTYKLRFNALKRGEYGLLPPGATASANAASSGKIYSFSIIE